MPISFSSHVSKHACQAYLLVDLLTRRRFKPIFLQRGYLFMVSSSVFEKVEDGFLADFCAVQFASSETVSVMVCRRG